MGIRIGINGFGRMGRLALRSAWGRDNFEFVHINEIACDSAGSAHLLRFDSVHGTWPHECAGDASTLSIDGQLIAYSQNAACADTDWSGCYACRMMDIANKIGQGL